MMGDAVDPRHDRREAGADRAAAGGGIAALARLRDGAVAVLTFAGFLPREAANRLVPLQKFLTNEIERRS